MIPELANRYNLRQVGRVLVFLKVYHNPSLVKHWCTYNIVTWNAASCTYVMTQFGIKTQMVMLRIGFYHNKFSHICVKHQHYPEHDILCMSVFFYWIFSIFSLINDSMFTMLLTQRFLELYGQTGIIFSMQ